MNSKLRFFTKIPAEGYVMPRVTVNVEACTACGICIATCPDVFVFAEGGKAGIDEKFRKSKPNEGEIPDQLPHCAKSAADNCPAWAITVE